MPEHSFKARTIVTGLLDGTCVGIVDGSTESERDTKVHTTTIRGKDNIIECRVF